MFVGTHFEEFICKEMKHLDRLVVFLCRNGMDPFKASEKLNQGVGSVVCEVHAGVLTSYEDMPPERSLIVKGTEHIPTYLMPLRVKYEDGYEGYTYRISMEVKKKDIFP